MLKRYLDSIIWITKNESKMTPNIWNDFHRLEADFDAWVATQTEDIKQCIESTIKAVRLVIKVFPECKILQVQE